MSADLNSNIRSAYIWTTVGNVVKLVTGLAISILLARLLHPQDYGLLGMVWIFVILLAAVQDIGLEQAIVHFNEDEANLPTYCVTSLLLGIVLAAICFGSAPPLAAFYHEDRLIPVVRVLSVSLLISSFRYVASGILVKHFRFRELSMFEVTSATTGGVVAVYLAWMGFGVWSLVANTLVSNLVKTFLICLAVPPRYTLHPKRDVLPRIFRYGLPLMGSELLFQFYDNADYLMVGRLMGPVDLGYYTLAFRQATMAHEKIAVVINKVAFPSFAAMQEEPEQLVEHWFTLARTISLVNFSLLVMLFVNAHDLLLIVFGAKWLPAVVPLQFLCVAGALRSLVHMILHIFNAMGATDLRLQFSILNSVLMPAAFYVGCKQAGLTGVGLAWCIVYPVVGLFGLVKVHRILPFSYLRYFTNLRIPVLAAMASFLVMFPIGFVTDSPLERLILRSVLGASTLGVVMLSRKRIRQQVQSLIKWP